MNTVVFRGGERIGHNTDWWGFAEAFRRGLPCAALDHVVQLGAGGAGAATAHAALSLGVRDLLLFDLESRRAEQLAADLSERFPDRNVGVGRTLSRRAWKRRTG